MMSLHELTKQLSRALYFSTECCSVEKCFLSDRVFLACTPSPVIYGVQTVPPRDLGGPCKADCGISALFTKKVAKNSRRRRGVICGSPQFECSSATIGTQDCGPMYSKS